MITDPAAPRTEDSGLIARLQERAESRKTATDEGKRPAAPPATSAQLEASEAALGFALPPLLRQLYLEVGSGGFGPGGGLLGLPNARLPGRLLPLCEWGSGISSALDCTGPESPVIRIDPNMAKAEVPARVPAALHFERAAEVKDACWVESPSLGQWLIEWLDGQPLFYAAYRGADADDEEEEDYEEEDGEEEEQGEEAENDTHR